MEIGNKYVFGVPIEEAERVLALYKYGIPCHNKDYIEGFCDGARFAVEEMAKIQDEAIKSVTSVERNIEEWKNMQNPSPKLSSVDGAVEN